MCLFAGLFISAIFALVYWFLSIQSLPSTIWQYFGQPIQWYVSIYSHIMTKYVIVCLTVSIVISIASIIYRPGLSNINFRNGTFKKSWLRRPHYKKKSNTSLSVKFNYTLWVGTQRKNNNILPFYLTQKYRIT